MTSSVTTGYTTTLDNYVTAIDYGQSSKQGCTHSQVFVTKDDGNFNQSYFVNDKTPATSWQPSGNTAAMGFASVGLNYQGLSSTTTQYNPYIFITYERELGSISGADALCTPTTYTYNGGIAIGDVLQWWLVTSDGLTQMASQVSVATSAGASASAETAFEIDPVALGLEAGNNYYLKLVVKNACCGLSVPIWKTLTVDRLDATLEVGAP